MNYHKYLFVPTPVKSDITDITSTAGSDAPHDGISASSPSGPVPDDASPAKEKSVPNLADSDGTRDPMVNGRKKEPSVSSDGGGAQTSSAESSRSRNEPRKNKVNIAKKAKKSSMFRRPLAGELGQRLYVMPPLPPTATTLAAFKSLLLDRLRLLRIAGKFNVDNVLGIPKELEQELNNEAAGGKSDVAGSTEVKGNPSGSSALNGSEEAQTTAQKALERRRRRRAERDFTITYPQMIKSELHAQHWMKVIRNTHDYQMLRSRILSLFLWPALLSSVRVADHNETQDYDRRTAPVASLLGSGRLVVEPSEVIVEEEEKTDPIDRKLDLDFTSPVSTLGIKQPMLE